MTRGKGSHIKPNSDVMTPKQVSFFLNIPLSTVYYFSKEGILPAFRVGHKWRYRRSDIESYLVHGPEANNNNGFANNREKQREAIRINTSIDCSFDITIPKRKSISGIADILNISHTGVLLEVTEYKTRDGAPKVDDPVNLHFKLNTIFAPPLNLEMKGRVSRVENTDHNMKLGVHFRDVPKELQTKFMLYTGEKLQ